MSIKNAKQALAEICGWVPDVQWTLDLCAEAEEKILTSDLDDSIYRTYLSALTDCRSHRANIDERIQALLKIKGVWDE